MTFYRADHEHHTGRAFGRVFENAALDAEGVLRSTGEFIWLAWRKTGKTISGVEADRYDAEDQVEAAMEELVA